MQTQFLTNSNILQFQVENEAEEIALLRVGSSYGQLNALPQAGVYDLVYKDKEIADELVRVLKIGENSEGDSIREMISGLITPEDRKEILDRHNRALDVIVVRGVLDFLEEEDPLLADILLNIQVLGRILNKYIMAKLREEEGV